MSQRKYSNKSFKNAVKYKYLGTIPKIKIASIKKLRVGWTQEILSISPSIRSLPLAIPNTDILNYILPIALCGRQNLSFR